ncbi:MAG: MATE family efflux transporter [Alphaproteobacteria bacterium]|nr:MATE family efflux transporter [Alphaproteobacteria bacterium]
MKPAKPALLANDAWRHELRATFALAWPLIIAQLAQIAFFTTDVVMMGWLGAEYLAAGTLATSFFHPFIVLTFGILTAVSPLVAQAIGRRNFRQVRRATRQGLWVALILSAMLIPFLWHIKAMLLLLGQNPEAADMAESYAHYAVWSYIPMLLFTVFRCFLSSHSNTSVILWITLMGVAANALGNYALMFGNWGLPRMELEGAGITTTVVNFLMLGMIAYYVLKHHRRYRRYHLLGRFWRPDWSKFREIWRVGTPIGLMYMIEVGLFATAAILMGWLGTDELAAHAVALQCAAIAFMIPLGLSQATTVRVGMAFGQHNRPAIRIAGWVSVVVGIGFMCVTCLLFWLLPEHIIGLFLDPEKPANQRPYRLAIGFLGVAALFQLADGAQVVSAAALRGLNDTAMPMIIALLCYWGIGFPVAYYCGFILQLGGQGIWYGLAAGLAFAAVVLCTRFALHERFLKLT